MNKKLLIFLVAAVLLAAIAVTVWGFGSSRAEGNDFDSVCGVGDEVKFCLAQVNRRAADEIVTMSQLTNEDNKELWAELKRVLDSYSYVKNDSLPNSSDYVCISLALSETVLYRIEVYTDLSVIIVGSSDGGSFRAIAPDGKESKLYSQLFDIIAN